MFALPAAIWYTSAVATQRTGVTSNLDEFAKHFSPPFRAWSGIQRRFNGEYTMKWSQEAEEAVQKVPFFVRKKVRARVEAEALKQDKKLITIAEINAAQKRFLTGTQADIKGYRIDTCFGPSGCPHAVALDQGLVEQITSLLEKAYFLEFLFSKGIKEPKFHHEFRVTLADCPNACSQPQIKDIGIIAARRPGPGDTACSACSACVDSCREAAIRIDANLPTPVIDMQRCLSCGQCVAACPVGTLTTAAEGYRVQLGGKLGRHPRLAHELPGIYDAPTTIEIVEACIGIYKTRSRRGERFGEILDSEDFQRLAGQFKPKAL
jgi:anaerobic sulfite reductase subunit C